MKWMLVVLLVISVAVIIATLPKDEITPRREREFKFRQYQERKDQ